MITDTSVHSRLRVLQVGGARVYQSQAYAYILDRTLNNQRDVASIHCVHRTKNLN